MPERQEPKSAPDFKAYFDLCKPENLPAGWSGWIIKSIPAGLWWTEIKHAKFGTVKVIGSTAEEALKIAKWTIAKMLRAQVKTNNVAGQNAGRA